MTVMGLLSVLVIGGVVMGGVVSAQSSDPVPLQAPASISATFYNGNPFDGGALVETDFETRLTDSSVGKAVAIADGEGANYVSLSLGERPLVFEISSVSSTTSTQLKNINGGATLTLGEVVEAVHDAARGETQLAIFTDIDGVATGFYSFESPDVAIQVAEAEFLFVAAQGLGQSYRVADPGTTTLSRVTVTLEGERLMFSRLNLL